MEAGRRIAEVSMVVLAMVAVVAQGQGRESFIQPDGLGDLGHCAKSCGLKCAFRLFPQRVAACFALCTLGCTIRPSQAVMTCANNCANSMLNRINPTDAAEGGVEAMVGSCYARCNKNN